jgi:hypothetical protein
MAKRQRPNIQLVPCAKCATETRHNVLHQNIDKGSDEHTWWKELATLLKCAGCGSVTLEKTLYFSEDVEPDGRPIPQITYYPTRPKRPVPEWTSHLPGDMHAVLTEIYEAHREGLIRLTAMGVRTLVDMMMVQEIGDIGGFEQKLDKLEKDGVLSLHQKETLATVVDAGSAAGHRGFKPAPALIDAMLDTIELVLKQRYVVAPMIESLKRQIPPRPPRPTKAIAVASPTAPLQAPPAPEKPKTSS